MSLVRDYEAVRIQHLCRACKLHSVFKPLFELHKCRRAWYAVWQEKTKISEAKSSMQYDFRVLCVKSYPLLLDVSTVDLSK